MNNCSSWSDCGSFFGFICTDGLCHCTPYWGYEGRECTEPSRFTFVLRIIYSILVFTCIVYQSLSFIIPAKYIFQPKSRIRPDDLDQVPQENSTFRKNYNLDLNPICLSLFIHGFFCAPNVTLVTFSFFGAVSFDPEMILVDSTFHYCFALGALGLSAQLLTLGLSWFGVWARFRGVEGMIFKVKVACFMFSILLSILVLGILLIIENESVLNIIPSTIHFVLIVVALSFGWYLSSTIRSCAFPGSRIYKEGERLRGYVISSGFWSFFYVFSSLAQFIFFHTPFSQLFILFRFVTVIAGQTIFLRYCDSKGYIFRSSAVDNQQPFSTSIVYVQQSA